MICEKCNNELSYGDKYCEKCGEKISSDIYKAEYATTIWAKLDKAKDEYDTFFLKKLTGNIFFKIISLVVVLGYLFFTMYGNLNGIRFMDSESYKIQYNKEADEYYIRPNGQNSQLDLFVPIGTDTIVFTAFSDGAESDKKEFTPDEYKQNGYTVTAGEYDYISIDAIRRGNAADSVKVIVVE